jgi:hypothetical protein
MMENCRIPLATLGILSITARIQRPETPLFDAALAERMDEQLKRDDQERWDEITRQNRRTQLVLAGIRRGLTFTEANEEAGLTLLLEEIMRMPSREDTEGLREDMT